MKMLIRIIIITLLLLALFICLNNSTQDNYSGDNYYDDEIIRDYAVEMDMNHLEAELDLEPYNIHILRHLKKLGHVFHIRHVGCLHSRCKRSAAQSHGNMLRSLQNHPMVKRVELQYDLGVEQKGEFYYSDRGLERSQVQRKMSSDVDELLDREIDRVIDVSKKHDGEQPFTVELIAKSNSTSMAKDKKVVKDEDYLSMVEARKQRLEHIQFNDKEAYNLWQYNNDGQFDINPGLDMNIYQVYAANITGSGVVATVIDDGLDTKHIELKGNFDPVASLDLNDPHNIMANPRGPKYRNNIPLIEGHGTSCASIIAGAANNRFCAFGVAFNANIGGIRMLARNMVTDLLEAYALTHNNEYIDIYSNSWGPKDTGSKTAPITYYVKKALNVGVEKGRDGKGSIFLFAAGNGGLNHDHCGADGLVNSPHTIAVTAVNIYGRKPAYTEECAAVSITAAVGGYSYGEIYEHHTIDPVLIAAQVNNKCLKRFLGTSAATPIIAGCIALALEANPDLSWRDIQHLFAISSRMPNALENVWQLNSAGILVSHYYGMGLLDCSAFVRNAQLWLGSGKEHRCIGGKAETKDILNIRARRRTRITFETTACHNSFNEVDKLEHVVIHTKIQHICRGDLAIVLTSPTGTKSYLLGSRKWDKLNSTVTFSHLSLLNWGESPVGRWHLDIADIGECSKEPDNKITGLVLEALLEFHGTSALNDAQTLNNELFENHFAQLSITKPSTTRILNEEEFYQIYDRQRKYFIKQQPLHKITNSFRKRYQSTANKTEELKNQYKKSLESIKDKISIYDYEYLTKIINES